MAALGASQAESHLFWQEMIPNSVTILVASEYAEPVSWNRGVPVKKKCGDIKRKIDDRNNDMHL
jgi:hypothetical protein